MKQIQSTIEGTWIELIPVTLTEEQQTLLSSMDEADITAKLALSLQIKADREVALTSEDVVIAEATYLANKPALAVSDTYQLIAVDMTLDNGVTSGILNCRVNGEHKQVRF
jgi:hypothetical protein